MTDSTSILRRVAAALCAILLASPLFGQMPISRDKQAMAELGRQYDSAWELYQALERSAGGGEPLSWDDPPDWSGIYEKSGRLMAFDPDQPEGSLPSVELTPDFQRRFQEKLERFEQGLSYDPLSDCAPAGHPRWLTEPFLREMVVTPAQTWLLNEMANDVRRIYTDGRGHMPEKDQYPLYNGDSIGFWDGHRLVVHTNQLRAGQYQRNQPDYTEQVETVEIWQKVDDANVQVDVWVYDPPALLEPWYVRQTYTKVEDPEKRLRIRYWHCQENSNNAVYQTEEGGTEFSGFTFLEEDNEQ